MSINSITSQQSVSPLAAAMKAVRDQAATFRKTEQQTSQLLQQMDAVKKSAGDDRKEAARQKVERLKAQIQALRLMAASNPKAAARQAAQIARELASAAREYAAAGGGGGGGVLGAPVAASSATLNSATQEQATAENSGTAAVPEGISTEVRFNQEDSDFASGLRKMMSDLRQIAKHAKEQFKSGEHDKTAQDYSDLENHLRQAEIALGNTGLPFMTSTVDMKA